MIRIGILGAARIARQAIIEPARTLGDILVVVAASNSDRAQRFADQHEIFAVADYEALINLNDIDLVYVALPPKLHRQWTVSALEAGKAVLCEKPFAMNTAEATFMTAAARHAKRPLIEAFHYRFHRLFRTVEKLLTNGEIGRVRRAEATFVLNTPPPPGDFRWNAALGGGALMDLGCYPLHALRTLLNSEPVVVQASSYREAGVDLQTTARLRFDEVEATIRCGFLGPTLEANLFLIGDKGEMRVNNYLAPHRGNQLIIKRYGKMRTREMLGTSTYQEQLSHTLSVLSGKETPLTGGEDSILTMCAIDSVRAAIDNGDRLYT